MIGLLVVAVLSGTPVVSVDSAPTYRIAKGKGTATLLHNASTGSKQVALSRLTLDPGAEVPEHSHETGEWLYILSGSAQMTLQGQALTVKAGDAVCLHKGKKHSANVPPDAKEPLVAVQVYSPAGAEQRFTKGEKVQAKAP